MAIITTNLIGDLENIEKAKAILDENRQLMIRIIKEQTPTHITIRGTQREINQLLTKFNQDSIKVATTTFKKA